MKPINYYTCITLLLLSSSLHPQALTIIQTPSTNFDERRNKKTGAFVTQPQFIILHYTSNCSLSKTIRFFKNQLNPVSTHYVIAHNGTIVQMVPESKRAWHAGKGSWQQYRNINTYSIGIELENPGFTEQKTDPCALFDAAIWNKNTGKQITGSDVYWQPFTKQQINSLMLLCKDIMQRYHILPQHILGHGDIAPGRKLDPGPLFPWHMLAQEGIGLWWTQLEHSAPITILDLQKKLSQFGYHIPLSGIFDTTTKNTIQAFQMHFRQNNINGTPDQETINILDNLLQQISSS